MVQGVEIFQVQPGRPVRPAGLARLLADRSQSPGPVAEGAHPVCSVYLKPDEAPEFLKASGNRSHHGTDWFLSLSSLGTRVLGSETGLACFKMGTSGLVVAPPFPVMENRIVDAWDPDPLLRSLEANLTIGVVLLRLGRFSVAVYQGRRLISSKTDARYVKGRHSAGGTSQKRFERIRQGQINRIYDKACQAVEVQLGPYGDQLDHIVLGGESFTIIGFLKSCPFLQRHEEIIQGRRLNVRDPKRDTLEKVGEMLWESRVWPLALDW